MSEIELSRRALLRAVGVGAGALASAGLAACGSDDDNNIPSNPADVSGKVTMWIYPIDPQHEKDWWPSKVSAFKQQYSKVDVEVVVQPWADRDTQLTTAIAGGKGPDLVYLIPDQVPQYAQAGSLAEVTDVIAADRSDFRPNALDAMTFDGKLYGVPILMSATATLVNKKILADAGIANPPSTWDDVLAAAPVLKAKGYYATEYVGDPAQTLNQTYYPLLWQAGGEVLASDGKKSAFNSDAGVAALDFLKQLVDGGYTPKDALTKIPPAETDPVGHGKVAFYLSRSVAELAGTAGVNLDDWEVVAPLKKAVSIGYGTVGGLSVLNGSKNQAAAKAWIKWLVAPDRLKEFDKNRKFYTTRISVGSLFADDPRSAAEEKFVDTVKAGVIHPEARQLMDLIKPEIQAALLSKKSTKQALEDAAKQVDDLLARG